MIDPPELGQPSRAIVERSPADATIMRSVGADLGRVLRPGDLVLLFGELGAGKTTMVTGIAEGIGHDPALVSSPTFVLCQEYTTPGAPTLVHVDAWRMSGADELESIGWDELRANPTLVICLEWPERVIGAIGDPQLAPRVVTVEIAHAAIGRTVRIHVDRERAARLGGSGAEAVARCRTCGAAIGSSDAHAPFCSERCRMADLHRWFVGDYRIGRSLTDEDAVEESDEEQG